MEILGVPLRAFRIFCMPNIPFGRTEKHICPCGFLSNVKGISLFHTVKYRNHTVEYKYRSVKQRICKGIHENMQAELGE